MSQNDKHLQIFSLKSNLISNYKGVSFNLANRKNSQHLRMKSVCFSTMLHSIRNQGIKQKYKQKQRQSVQCQKENNGMVVSANKCHVAQISNINNTIVNVNTSASTSVYGQDTPLVVEVPRISMPQSKSFLIRSHNNKKPASSHLQLKRQEIKKINEKQQMCFQIYLKNYNFCSAKQLIHQISILPVIKNKLTIQNQSQFLNNDNNQNDKNLSIILPSAFIKSQNTAQILQLFKTMSNKQIYIFILVFGKQKAQKLHKIYEQYCNIIYLQLQHKNNHTKQYFINCSNIKKYLSKNILIFQQPTFIKDSILYYPYFQPQLQFQFQLQTNSKYENCDMYDIGNLFDQQQGQVQKQGQKQNNKQIRMGFIKIQNLNLIKCLQFQNKNVKIYMQNTNRRYRLSHYQHCLKNVIKMQIQTKHRYSLLNQHHTNHVTFPSYQSMQQKLVQYSKILKKQSKQVNLNNASNETISLSSHCIDLKHKQQSRRSLIGNSKTAYQIVNQLVRNNINIHKQINTYYNQSRNININMNMKEKQVQCDDIYYYCIQ